MNICSIASVVACRLIETLRTKTAFIAGFCALALCSWQSPEVWAQPGIFSDPTLGDNATDDFSGSVSLGNDGSYLLFNQNIGDRFGFQDGFSQFGIFTPIFQRDPNNLIFGTASVIVSDQTRVGASGGAGIRHFFPSFGKIAGFNTSYVTDDSMTGSRYEQINVGAELLGDAWDLRANAYIPLNRQDNPLGIVSQGTTPTFINGQLVYINQRAVEEQLMGGDVELGAPVPTQTWLKAFIGAYYYDTTDPADVVGVSGRMTAQVSTDMNLFVGVSEDKRFGTNLTGGVSITFNGSTGHQFFPSRTIDQRMFDQVVQNFRIAQNVFNREETSVVINPDTNAPFTIIWVDNSNPNPGDGSFENPFQSMHDKMCSDIMFVRTGTTSAMNPLVSEFFLCDDQRLLGEGLPHLILGNVIDVPGVAINGPRPFITTGAGGDIVTLANRNEVSGLNLISPAGGNAITNTFAIESLNVNNVNVTDLGNGVNLRNIRGNLSITDSTFALTGAPSPGAISVVNNNQQDLNLNIDGVTISGGEQGIRLSATNSTINGLLNNVSDNASGTGLSLAAATNGSINITMNNGSFMNSNGAGAAEGDGIAVFATNGGDVFIDATDTTLTGNFDNALDVTTLSGGS
ncbi:MAG: inverse autotransporter beta domain-containing protein, partial [Planctomycetaceae bacterium]